MTAPPAPAWRAALSLFTVVPVAGPAEIRKDTAARAILWLPALGCLLAAVAAAVLFAVEVGGHSAPRRLLAATLAVAVLALLTGGLHLDGLADTVDGLGSRRPRQEALDIMRAPMSARSVWLRCCSSCCCRSRPSPRWHQECRPRWLLWWPWSPAGSW